MSDFDKYSKLTGGVEYDHEAAEQLAEALNEIFELEQRAEQLKQIVQENKKLHQFIWRTEGGQAIAIHDLENDHLENIMMYLLRNNRSIPRAIRSESMRRKLVIPATVPIDWSKK